MTPEAAIAMADERRILLGHLVQLRVESHPRGIAVGLSRHAMSVGPTVAAACLAWCEAHPLLDAGVA